MRKKFFIVLAAAAAILMVVSSCKKEEQVYRPANICGIWSCAELSTSSIVSLVVSANELPNNSFICSFKRQKYGEADTVLLSGFLTYDRGNGAGAISTTTTGAYSGSISNVTEYSMRLFIYRVVDGKEVSLFNGVLRRE